jgi:hypothetical protein
VCARALACCEHVCMLLFEVDCIISHVNAVAEATAAVIMTVGRDSMESAGSLHRGTAPDMSLACMHQRPYTPET